MDLLHVLLYFHLGMLQQVSLALDVDDERGERGELAEKGRWAQHRVAGVDGDRGQKWREGD